MTNPNKNQQPGQYEAITRVTLEKPGNPASRREIQPGQTFDATPEELQHLTRDQDYREKTQP